MPKGNLTYKRGEIHWVNLDPTIGAETQKTRPCLIVQNNIMNQHGLLTIVIPFRSGSKNAPYLVNVKATKDNGLEQDSFIDLGQLRAVDYRRIIKFIGVLEEQYWESIQQAVLIVLGFTF